MKTWLCGVYQRCAKCGRLINIGEAMTWGPRKTPIHLTCRLASK